MIELPNGLKSRTLPEQVGYNSAKIAEIIQFLNESGLKDLVINLEEDSGVLSPEQYAIAQLSPSYVVYDGGVFYKTFEDSDYIDFFLLMENVDTENSDMAVNHWRIRVQKSNQNYALDTVNVYTSYNKSQIDSLLSAGLALKASLTGADFTGAITAPANYSGVLQINESVIPEGLSVVANPYLAFKIDNNVLYVIVEFGIENTTESAISSGAISWKGTVPNPYAAKIIRRDGTNLSNAYSSLPTIAKVVGCIDTVPKQVSVHSYLANQLEGYFDSISIAAGSTARYSCRYFLYL